MARNTVLLLVLVATAVQLCSVVPPAAADPASGAAGSQGSAGGAGAVTSLPNGVASNKDAVGATGGVANSLTGSLVALSTE
ncbi:hypothetical protein SETIT_8G146200v2 [Setaria italica]|uniref:Uncharacterized protein n=1 Tax=Setaria italica TaxID=4555 RepID=A0A368S7R9_SETIT|nr:hypothetical protein SETIT_8G146200v2 [Setaria italica]